MIILALNAGSSSLKYSVLDTEQETTLLEGRVEMLGTGKPEGQFCYAGEKSSYGLKEDNHYEAVVETLELIQNALIKESKTLHAIGHRVVHGGDAFNSSVRIDGEVIEQIRNLSPLAPLHNPAHADVIEASVKAFPAIPQVAVFDTAFHQTIPEYIYRYAVPNEWYTEHKVRRYGFHGTSHSYVSKKAIKEFNLNPDTSNLIVAHLGNGCSATAIVGGKSRDTTMGLSPLEGFIMGTRSGNVDPNLHSYIATQTGLSLEEITSILNKKSGLFALTEGTSDMRAIQAEISEGNEAYAVALEIFCYRLAKEIMGLFAALDGPLDGLLFTGGIGENNGLIRKKICERLHSVGLELDESQNERKGSTLRRISRDQSPLVAIVPTNEELEIALQTEALTALISSPH